jgi:hypothetical protein
MFHFCHLEDRGNGKEIPSTRLEIYIYFLNDHNKLQSSKLQNKNNIIHLCHLSCNVISLSYYIKGQYSAMILFKGSSMDSKHVR